MKKQNYFCVDLQTRMQSEDIRVGEVRNGTLVMTHDQERFEFTEQLPDRYTRNPKVWRGRYLNISLDKQGRYSIHFHRMLLSESLAPGSVSAEILKDLLDAKKVLL